MQMPQDDQSTIRHHCRRNARRYGTAASLAAATLLALVAALVPLAPDHSAQAESQEQRSAAAPHAGHTLQAASNPASRNPRLPSAPVVHP